MTTINVNVVTKQKAIPSASAISWVVFIEL
jgi:hypothetical protein